MISLRVEFLQVYDVTELVEKKLSSLPCYMDAKYSSVFIQEDVHDFHVYRVQEGYNTDYEPEEGVYLTEYNRVSRYDIPPHLEGIDKLFSVLKADDREGLSNWEAYESYDYEDCVDLIDGGYGIKKLILN